MQYDFNESLEILERTPKVLRGLLQGISDGWILNNEGDKTWSPFDVVGHLIHGEKTDWIPRAKIILEYGTSQAFESFDRFAQFEMSKDKTLNDLLDEFENLKKQNITEYKSLNIEANLDKKENILN